MRGLAFLAAIFSLTSAATVKPRQSSACNNFPDLCSRSYSAITHLGAHDSPFLRDSSTDYSTSGNQYFNTTVQLAAGVRLLTAQVHRSNNNWHLCHTSCDLLDAGTLQDWLQEIKTWMDSNPNDVVTILLVNSDNATPSDLTVEFVQSGISTYAYVPPDDNAAIETWPTLQALIDAKTRLMVFVASLDTSSYTAGQHYLMDEFTFIFENQFTNTNVSDFSCTPNRPSSVEGNSAAAIASNRMSLINHFLDASEAFGIDVPNVDAANTTNSADSAVGNLGQAAAACKSEYGKQPTFLLVDFFDQGPAIDTVDSLNGVTNPVGRTQPPAEDSNSSDRSTTTFAGVADLVAEVENGQTPKLGAWIWAAGDWSLGGINLSGGSIVS